MFSEANSEKKETREENEKPFKCTGCETPLSKNDEYCPNCERINPKYLTG
ncbi:MAG: hypothetical protein H7644_02730 [Candidatus Heimdallarchaeota archaeon]|nr:hypothetical protein [Candidatus Heimdallarchaeota archaeon]MCK5142659.1 hypothetical protein [Candidatus Heimdallarchaeota archaeon]